ncbi:MAG: permease [Bacillota bacterium]|jgi:uncharacterized membrane protein YraQ (UPF0718 family)
MIWPPDWQLLLTIFQSVLLEAFPFVLVGVLVSALIEVFVDQDIIHRMLPKNRLVSMVAACLLGLLFPLCECGIVPVVRRLVNKGVPISAGIAFMLAAPIINPVVIASTAMAFAHQPTMILHRILGGFLVALTIGLTLEAVFGGRKAQQLLLQQTHGSDCEHRDHGSGHQHDHHHHPGHDHDHEHKHHSGGGGLLQKGSFVLSHACDEFFSTGKFLILGAFLAALLQSVLSHRVLDTLGQHPLASRFSMMGLAYGLSLCSEADAFVASTFAHSFLPGAVLAFLLLGPMIDIKNTLMLLGNFRTRFVLLLIPLIIAVVTAYSYLMGIILPI